MIPQAHIVEWRATAPWISDAQVEQDLIISRALVSLFSSKSISENFAFRGGTALHKLYMAPASRYSEDIDLVQVDPKPIGPFIDEIRQIFNGFLRDPRRKQGEDTVTLTYRADSEIPPAVPMKLKIEINSREHYAIDGYVERDFNLNSRWFSGTCKIRTYTLAELLGTKLRALYQRRKGRDLFDLWLGLTLGKADPKTITTIFKKYVAGDGLTISRTEFRDNLESKMTHRGFLADTESLILGTIPYDPIVAHRLVQEELIQLL